MKQKIWHKCEIRALYELPFLTLLFQAQSKHRKYFKSDEIELCALLSIKTGACPEDCAYCTQSAHYKTNVLREKLLSLDVILKHAKCAKENGAIRFCMGAAWRNISDKNLPHILQIIRAVKALQLETCMTLGMVNNKQAQELKTAGLDYYNHNIDTSKNFYSNIVTTHSYEDRINTIANIHAAGIHICTGGILGMGESDEDRIDFLWQLTQLAGIPKSIPINRLIPMQGTPLQNATHVDDITFIRIIAICRILFPTSMIRLSAGRISMSREMQILCFLAGANSMWLGDKLLTAKNPDATNDFDFLSHLGIKIKISNNVTTV